MIRERSQRILFAKLLAAAPLPTFRDLRLADARVHAGEFGTTGPWNEWAGRLRDTMPEDYFRTVPAEEIAKHITRLAILGGQEEDRIIDATTQTYTYFVVKPWGKLGSILERLANQQLSVKRANLYLSRDGSIGIYVFNVGEQAKADLTHASVSEKVRAFREAVGNWVIPIGREFQQVTDADRDKFLGSLSRSYLESATLGRLIRHFELYMHVLYQDRDSIVEIDRSPTSRASRVTLVARNIPQTGYIQRIVRILDRYDLDLQKVFVESLENDVTTSVLRELDELVQSRGGDPVSALVSIFEDPSVPQPQRDRVEAAILSWGESAEMARNIQDLLHDEERRNDVREELIRQGTEALEAARIITFYMVKHETGEPLDERRDEKLMRELSADLEAARWSMGEGKDEFLDPSFKLHQEVWRPRQLTFLYAAATFAHEMWGYIQGDGEAYSWDRVRRVFLKNPEITRLFVDHFELRFNPNLKERYLDRNALAAAKAVELNSAFQGLKSEEDRAIFGMAIAFAKVVKDTNYFRPTSSLAFELDGGFVHRLELPNGQIVSLPKDVHPETPYGVYYVVGNGARFYHNRFEDVARGGWRQWTPTADEPFEVNTTRLYRVGYRLAFTQDHKNLEGRIPEGGAKGIYALMPGYSPRAAGLGCVDGVLDLILGTDTQIFVGPDVDTGKFMELWAQRARRRGYPFWRTFTSAKDEMGIRHDRYAMTTRGVFGFEVLALQKLRIAVDGSSKVITGGPRGDVAGNEIKMSIERGMKIYALYDRSGVIYDPNGLDHRALGDLVDRHGRVKDFPRDKLSPGGFLILPGGASQTVRLPGDREVSWDYKTAKSEIVFELEADAFMPGEKTENFIHEGNVHRLIIDYETAGARPRYRVISEGANLAITQKAREILEDHGVIVIKDQTANKRGVGSSSHEIRTDFMLDTPDEFEAIRAPLVDQIIRSGLDDDARQFEEMVALQARARTGEIADPDFRYLSRISDRVTGAARKLKKRLLAVMTRNGLPQDPAIDALILSGVLPVLRERHPDRIGRLIPKYRIAMIAEALAHFMIKEHGLDHQSAYPEITTETIVTEARALLASMSPLASA